MAQVRKLQNGGNTESPPANENTPKPQMLKVGNTEYSMDTYIRELESNFEGWLDSTNFNDEQKNEQRRLLPIFVQKLRSGVVTPLEGGGWRDSSLEMYNERKKKHDKWGALAWFATEGLRHQKPYNQQSAMGSREPSEYDPSTGLSSLRNLLFGSSKQSFINLDDWSDNTRTKRGLVNRSAQVKRGLETFKSNPEKYYKFKFQEDKDDIMDKVDYILDNVMQDGIISPNEHFYLSQLGLGDISDLFVTDFSQSATPGNNNQQVTPGGGNQQGSGQYGNGQYGNTASAESIASWLGSKPIYAVKKTAGIQDLGLGNLSTIGPNTVADFRTAITRIQDQKKISRSIYDYFYNRKPGGQKLDTLLSLFQNNLQLQGFANRYPNQVIKLILDEMVTNGSADLEDIGGNKYILSRTRNKNNTVLMWDSANGRLSEVSAFYSPSFRNKVLQKFAEETGIYNIPAGLDWYSAFYKQGGVLMAKKGVSFYNTYYNDYYQFDPSAEGQDNVFWDQTLRDGRGAYRSVKDGETGIPRATVNSALSYSSFNTFRRDKNKINTNGWDYIGFNPSTATYYWNENNLGDNNVELPGVYNKGQINLPTPGKETTLYRMNKSVNDFSRQGLISDQDEVFSGNWDNINEANDWVTNTLKADSGYTGIYSYDGKWYRTKTAPTTGTLLTASIVNGWKPDTKTDQVETLSHGPSNFDKFMQFFGPATGDIAAGIFTHQRNNRGLEKLKDAMHPNYKTMPLEVFDPLNINYSAYTAGHQRGIDIESRARESAANFNDPSLAVAANRQGTLDRIANDSTVDSTINQDLQTQIQNRTTAQNQRNDLAAKTAYDNQVEDHRVELAEATAEVENDKTNTEVWNRIMAKYAGQIGDYFTANVTKKQETADTANKLQAQAWLDDAMVTEKAAWKSRNPGASDSDWLLSPEYKRIKLEFNRMIALGDAYTPSSGSGGRWAWVSSDRNGGVLSLRTQALLNKVIK